MIIKSIAASLPERRVSNEEIIEIIRQHSTGHYDGDLDRRLKMVLNLLKRTGLKERRWCDRHESPIDHVAKAVRKVLEDSYLRRNHIELLIYVGIGRGFIEPGNSHVIANTLGFENAQCFDVVDACMSWVRALQLVDSLFKSGSYKNALVINAEFNMHENGPLYPDNFVLRNAEQLAYTFPTFTIGEAATATLLTPQEPDNFEFHFTSRPDLSDLCTIPMAGYKNFCHPSEKMGKNDILRFTSFGQELHKEGFNEIIEVFKKLTKGRVIDKVFVHASSKKEWDRFGNELGLTDKIHQIYPETGNLVSASVPTSIYNAKINNLISRGDELALWVGSAGMAFNATNFKY
ncbi:MAG: 3-oxoacyl-ACP synthase [Gammaproteobacteria bacterium]|nr:3-oxoacyl-ACP synthase [Gammaproteobacteria bacterium]MDH5652973.1 3-oxoacyl-ACP synthase [Gammaproteobacteria bacterium]